MNYILKEKRRIEKKISVGFVMEVFLFMIAGYFFCSKSAFGFITFFFLGFWLARIVGGWIEKAAIIRYKYSLDN